MSDRERVDAVLEHVAVLAFLYYPGSRNMIRDTASLRTSNGASYGSVTCLTPSANG
jgi:hypothetical protein